ncbi:hypothetical protein SEPCBS57363_006394 [Sporothrix epigloea]|uniref:Uncharacterized protein n=1 Tax=Sporothrix epigloea TaxID=1892477 RepID=A0ABP0E5E4_9PEZI
MSRQGRRRETIKGSWTDAEDKRLTYIVTTASSLNWSNVADEMQGRSAKQCRERWVQNLRPDLEHEPINEMEGNFIMAQVETLGKKWAEIARRLEYDLGRIRSDNNVKNWYNGTVNRLNRAERRRENSALHRYNASLAAAAALSRPSPSFSSPCRSRSPRPMPQQLALAHQRELPLPMTSASDVALVSPTSTGSFYGEHRKQHHLSHAAPIHPSNGPRSYPATSPHGAPGPQLYRRPSVHQLPPLQDALRYSARDREFDLQWPKQEQQQSPPQYQAQPTYYSQRLSERRTSVYTMSGSPQSDRHYVPSLVSDTGSLPSPQESPTHAPASPNAIVAHTLPPLAAMDFEEKAAYGASRSPPTMTRSWSGRSDDLCESRTLPPAVLEPQVMESRSRSSSRGISSFAINHLLNP